MTASDKSFFCLELVGDLVADNTRNRILGFMGLYDNIVRVMAITHTKIGVIAPDS